MKHKDKIKLAKKMISKREMKYGVPVFQSKAWFKRKDARLKKEANRLK